MSNIKLMDMQLSKETKAYPSPAIYEGPTEPAGPMYPYGLCITLTEDEIKKLDIDTSDVEFGDMLNLCIVAKVTNVSKREDESGSHERVELQITHLGVDGDDEGDE